MQFWHWAGLLAIIVTIMLFIIRHHLAVKSKKDSINDDYNNAYRNSIYSNHVKILTNTITTASKKLKESIKGPVKQSIKDNNKDANYGLEDGEITLGVGGKANTITITLKDGTKKTYTFGKFRNYFKGSSIGRQGELQHYLDKIENYNI